MHYLFSFDFPIYKIVTDNISRGVYASFKGTRAKNTASNCFLHSSKVTGIYFINFLINYDILGLEFSY